MAPVTVTKYFKVVGAELLDDGNIRHLAREVADYQGTPLDATTAGGVEYTTTPDKEQPRGTIVKVTKTTNVTFTPNPTS